MFGHKAGPSLVYEYGCLPPVKGEELVEEQLRLANRYHNKLVEIELTRRKQVREYLASIADVAALEGRVTRLLEELNSVRDEIKSRRQVARSNVDTSDLNARAKALRLSLSDAREELRAAKKRLTQDEAVKAKLDEINRAANEAVRQARAECGLYWGTYLTIEQGFDRARRGTKDPRFHRYDGEGCLAVQLQGGLPASEIFGIDTRVQVDPVPEAAWTSPVRSERRRLSRTRIRIRVGSNGRDPVWAELPMIMHRPLPANSLVKWVRLFRVRVGRWYRYKVQFVVELTSPLQRPTGHGVVAIDLGWRQVEGGLRVAYWVDEHGEKGQLLIPDGVLTQFNLLPDLRSIRDKRLEEAKAVLAWWLRNHADEVPDWLKEATKTLHAWRSPERMARLLAMWGERRFPADERPDLTAETLSTLAPTIQERDCLDQVGIYRFLVGWNDRDNRRYVGWLAQERHLYDWEANLRDQLRAWRLNEYRKFANCLRSRYGAVVLEDFDLRDVAKERRPEDGPDTRESARRQQRIAAVFILRQAIEQSGLRVVKLPSAYTTKRCHVCGHVEKFDSAKQVMHTCSACGALWDQDENAARNLLADGMRRLSEDSVYASG